MKALKSIGFHLLYTRTKTNHFLQERAGRRLCYWRLRRRFFVRFQSLSRGRHRGEGVESRIRDPGGGDTLAFRFCRFLHSTDFCAEPSVQRSLLHRFPKNYPDVKNSGKKKDVTCQNSGKVSFHFSLTCLVMVTVCTAL